MLLTTTRAHRFALSCARRKADLTHRTNSTCVRYSRKGAPDYLPICNLMLQRLKRILYLSDHIVGNPWLARRFIRLLLGGRASCGGDLASQGFLFPAESAARLPCPTFRVTQAPVEPISRARRRRTVSEVGPYGLGPSGTPLRCRAPAAFDSDPVDRQARSSPRSRLPSLRSVSRRSHRRLKLRNTSRAS